MFSQRTQKKVRPRIVRTWRNTNLHKKTSPEIVELIQAQYRSGNLTGEEREQFYSFVFYCLKELYRRKFFGLDPEVNINLDLCLLYWDGLTNERS
jgi:hypothetical protein